METYQKAQEAGRIAMSGTTGVAQTNAGLEKMVAELRQELHQMRMKIEGAEELANTAQRITDSAEQRANTAQYATDAAEQRAVAAQNDANAAKAKQQLLQQELQNADWAFQEERKIRTSEIEAAQHTIGALQHELRNTTTLEMATEFLNAVRVRPCFFYTTGSVRPSVSVFFFGVASTYVRHTDR